MDRSKSNSHEKAPQPESRQSADKPAAEASAEQNVETGQASQAEEGETSQQQPAEQQSLQEELAQVRAERDANYQRAVRIQAELENYRKRSQREIQESRRYQIIPLVRDLLPVLDNLYRAIEAAQSSQQAPDLVQGVEMVAQQIEETLAQYSVVPIEAVGTQFDPNRHEAVQQVPSADHEPMTVIEEVQRGYMLDDRVVRPSKVVISSAPAPQEDSAEEKNNES